MGSTNMGASEKKEEEITQTRLAGVLSLPTFALLRV